MKMGIVIQWYNSLRLIWYAILEWKASYKCAYAPLCKPFTTKNHLFVISIATFSAIFLQVTNVQWESEKRELYHYSKVLFGKSQSIELQIPHKQTKPLFCSSLIATPQPHKVEANESY